MGKLYVHSQAHTPVDDIRQGLDRAERMLSNGWNHGSEALELLHLFDQIAIQILVN